MTEKNILTEGQQLTLSLGKKPKRDFDGFVDGDNAQLVASLKGLPTSDARDFYFVWGEEGCGKSHLLQAASQLATQVNRQSIYLEAEQLIAFGPGVLEGMEHFDLVCLDDIDRLLTRRDWEEALFHFYNKLTDVDCSLVVSARAAPRQLTIGLADLQSRLCSGEVYQISTLGDDAKVELMVSSAFKRGFQLSVEVAVYIIQRSARDVSSLQNIVEQLDALSLREQRLITVPFVKKVLGW